MRNWKKFFEKKRVTIMGLGLLGRGLGDATFLAEQGALLTITDLRDEKTLAPSLDKLKKYRGIRYTLGQHLFEDFENRDFILKAAGVALDSPYIAHAEKNGIPIEMDASLFARLAPKGITLVGVTGTRGKSTTTALIYDILCAGIKRKELGENRPTIYKGGNLVSEATLPLIKKVKTGDIVVLELDSWQLQGFHDAQISPQVAVFTTFLDDHLTYYKNNTDRYFEDKVAIFKYQKPPDLLVQGEKVVALIQKSEIPIVGSTTISRKEDVSKEWKIPLLGEHNLENIACAIAVARHFAIPEATIKTAVENFKAVPGRLEFLREVDGVKIYNDNNATTPDATVAALKALHDLRFKNYDLRIHKSNFINHKSDKHIVLIMGGTDKGLDMAKLVEEIPKHCKAVILLRESGTDKLKPLIQDLRFKIYEKGTLRECVEKSMEVAEPGDIVLFSPAFASFGKWFKNEYDRGEQFVRIVSSL